MEFDDWWEERYRFYEHSYQKTTLTLPIVKSIAECAWNTGANELLGRIINKFPGANDGNAKEDKEFPKTIHACCGEKRSSE